MRIGPFEVNWSPRTNNTPKTGVDDVVWHRVPCGASRLGDLTPEQLRVELAIVKAHLKSPGNTIHLDNNDPFQRVYLVIGTRQRAARNTTPGSNRGPKRPDTLFVRRQKTFR